jgi:hypothetical protein
VLRKNGRSQRRLRQHEAKTQQIRLRRWPPTNFEDGPAILKPAFAVVAYKSAANCPLNPVLAEQPGLDEYPHVGRKVSVTQGVGEFVPRAGDELAAYNLTRQQKLNSFGEASLALAVTGLDDGNRGREVQGL